MKIYIAEPVGIDATVFQNALPEHEIHFLDTRGWSDDRLIEALMDCELLVLTNRPISSEVIDKLPHLAMISVAFSGIDHIDAKAVSKRGIRVMNAAGYAKTAVSELVFGYLLTLARSIGENNIAVRQGAGTSTGRELKGKILGIVGYGAIGQEVERLAYAFGMRTLVYSRRNGQSLDELFACSDYISLHLPLNDSTRGIIDARLLGLMKSSAFLINTARGPVIKQEDLLEVLRVKRIGGAALDVFDSEPPLSPQHALLQLDNVLATPHIGFNTEEALQSKGEIALENIKVFLSRDAN